MGGDPSANSFLMVNGPSINGQLPFRLNLTTEAAFLIYMHVSYIHYACVTIANE